MQNEDGTTRSRRKVVAVGAIGVAGIIGGMTVGAGMFAGAATTAPVYSSELSQCANPSAPVPGAPVYTNHFTVGGGRVSGTVPAIPAATLTADNITPTLVNVVITTQYNSGRSGANKTSKVTASLPGHQYHNPLLFNIPPVSNSVVVGTGTVAYSAVTDGNAFANVTVSEFIVQATSTIPSTVVGTVCPSGTTKVGSLAGQNAPLPAAPTAVTATPVAVAPEVADTAPNNGSVQVKYTPTVQTNGSQVDSFAVLATDVTVPTTKAIEETFNAPADTTSTAQRINNVTGLNRTHTYVFQVYAVGTTGVVGNASAATTPAVTPATETTAMNGTATGQFQEKSTK